MCDWDFIEAALTTHNHWRQRHGVPNLRYNRDLERIAQGWAVHIAQTGQPASSTNLYMRQPVGENIVIRGSKQGEDMSGREASDIYYSGVARYDFNSHALEDQCTGQFSQVVWRDTEEMGMGKAFSDDGRCIIVTNYFPSGNVVGYYPYNVLPPIDGKIIMPGDNPVKKVVKTDTVREIHGGVPYLKTITTETTTNADGTRSVVTKQTMDQIKG